MHNTTQDLEYLAKNFNGVNTKHIADKALLRLSIYILATEYLEERDFCFIKVTGDNKKMNKEMKIISNWKKEIKIKRIFCKKKKNV